MAEQNQYHHHHHHHHKMDDASRFKRKSLMAIDRRKKLAKWGYVALWVVAVIMAVVVAVVYSID